MNVASISATQPIIYTATRIYRRAKKQDDLNYLPIASNIKI
jgi:hypothetical protein